MFFNTINTAVLANDNKGIQICSLLYYIHWFGGYLLKFVPPYHKGRDRSVEEARLMNPH